MKNTFDELISRLNMAEERISELDDMTIETSQTEKHRKKNFNIQELWDNYIRYNISVIGIPEEKERNKQKKYSKQ